MCGGLMQPSSQKSLLHTYLLTLVTFNSFSNLQVTAESTYHILTGQIWSPVLDTWDHTI